MPVHCAAMPPDPLETCLRRDQHRLRRERDRLRGQQLRGTDVAAAERALAERIAASADARARPRANADCSRRVARGGAWYNTARFLRSASRVGLDASGRLNSHGFRLARTLAP